jgi:hypothetical protein
VRVDTHELVGGARGEATPHEVRRRLCLGHGAQHATAAAARDALDLELARQAGDALVGDAEAVNGAQLGVDARAP